MRRVHRALPRPVLSSRSLPTPDRDQPSLSRKLPHQARGTCHLTASTPSVEARDTRSLCLALGLGLLSPFGLLAGGRLPLGSSNILLLRTLLFLPSTEDQPCHPISFFPYALGSSSQQWWLGRKLPSLLLRAFHMRVSTAGPSTNQARLMQMQMYVSHMNALLEASPRG